MNSGVITFLVVIFGSVFAGVATGAIAHYMGNESLAGISSPQENPTAQFVDENDNSGEGFSLINEQEILTEINDLKQRHKSSQK
ncbi:hypothetical protein IQ215_09340 [Cyanobacterium stanieri LEGE 03274]|uniref:Uncharacterized protein n=1 Tax=Cyanobacterium stanieri LEGE 03274 TaxID=1828756 RepID=A0ABR9V4S3_9CHRO|nr:hypothetical protein [Cyanobacterium stanieri]MBE9222896.1 hypothetical protein [Cyanobacterium stanieri LEGE 03274]